MMMPARITPWSEMTSPCPPERRAPCRARRCRRGRRSARPATPSPQVSASVALTPRMPARLCVPSPLVSRIVTKVTTSEAASATSRAGRPARIAGTRNFTTTTASEIAHADHGEHAAPAQQHERERGHDAQREHDRAGALDVDERVALARSRLRHATCGTSVTRTGAVRAAPRAPTRWGRGSSSSVRARRGSRAHGSAGGWACHRRSRGRCRRVRAGSGAGSRSASPRCRAATSSTRPRSVSAATVATSADERAARRGRHQPAELASRWAAAAPPRRRSPLAPLDGPAFVVGEVLVERVIAVERHRKAVRRPESQTSATAHQLRNLVGSRGRMLCL